MNVQLSPETEELLRRRLAEGRFADADAMIAEALRTLEELSLPFASAEETHSSDEGKGLADGESRVQALEELRARLAEMGVQEPDDGLHGGRDHDRILYGQTFFDRETGRG